jgi:hypothetical protein
MIQDRLKVTKQGALHLVGELALREMTGRGHYHAWGDLTLAGQYRVRAEDCTRCLAGCGIDPDQHLDPRLLKLLDR